jgi:very-short-patch-repair endonuclease
MEFEVIDNYKEVTCRVCGRRSKRIYGGHLRSHNLTSYEYLRLYPGSPLMTKEDTEKMGNHMKDDKYKKMFREMCVGDKNPNHKSRTTDEERRKRSPFSKKFVKYEDLDNKDLVVSEFVKVALSNRVSPLQKEYYLNQGFTEEESIELLSKRQSTFSLKKCIEKYGEVDGLERWKERQNKWLLNNKKVNYSQISQNLFIEVFNKLKEISFHHRVYFAKLDESGSIHNSNRNYEYRLKLNNSYIMPDFFIPDFKLIIEFDGTYYHKKTPENKLREEKRDNEIKNAGYRVIHISEDEFNKNKDLVIMNLLVEILKLKNKNQNDQI